MVPAKATGNFSLDRLAYIAWVKRGNTEAETDLIKQLPAKTEAKNLGNPLPKYAKIDWKMKIPPIANIVREQTGAIQCVDVLVPQEKINSATGRKNAPIFAGIKYFSMLGLLLASILL